MGQPLQDFHDFSANINPLGVAPSIKEAIEYHLPYIIHYPDAQATLLKQAISEYYRVPLEQIILGNGAVELLYLLSHLFGSNVFLGFSVFLLHIPHDFQKGSFQFF